MIGVLLVGIAVVALAIQLVIVVIALGVLNAAAKRNQSTSVHIPLLPGFLGLVCLTVGFILMR